MFESSGIDDWHMHLELLKPHKHGDGCMQDILPLEGSVCRKVYMCCPYWPGFHLFCAKCRKHFAFWIAFHIANGHAHCCANDSSGMSLDLSYICNICCNQLTCTQLLLSRNAKIHRIIVHACWQLSLCN